MNEKRFWEIVEGIGWGNLCLEIKPDFEAASLRTAKSLSRQEANEFRTILDEKVNIIAKLAEQRVSLGDDSFGDLCHHVVGLGQDFYENTLADPDTLKTLKFRESFSYCVPGASDYEMLQDGYFEKQIFKFFEEVYLGLLDFTEQFDSTTEAAFVRVSNVIGLLQDGKIDELPEGEVVSGAWKQMSRGRFSGTLQELNDFSNTISRGQYWLENIVNSARRVAKIKTS